MRPQETGLLSNTCCTLDGEHAWLFWEPNQTKSTVRLMKVSDSYSQWQYSKQTHTFLGYHHRKKTGRFWLQLPGMSKYMTRLPHRLWDIQAVHGSGINTQRFYTLNTIMQRPTTTTAHQTGHWAQSLFWTVTQTSSFISNEQGKLYSIDQEQGQVDDLFLS